MDEWTKYIQENNVVIEVLIVSRYKVTRQIIGNGKSLFVCKSVCQGTSKVSAVENIIRELHGPVDAMLSLCGTA